MRKMALFSAIFPSLTLSDLMPLSGAQAQDPDPTPRESIFPDVDQINIYTGVDYSSGDYGSPTADTDILYLYGAAEAIINRWRFRVTVPWIDIKGPGGVTGGPRSRWWGCDL